MVVILPKPNVPFLLERPDLVTPQWYEKLKQVADQSGVSQSLTAASEAEAIAGTENTKYSTPLRVADAIKGYEFATRGALERTIIDRARDWIIVNDFSDGTGTGSNDLAALNAAWAAWKADPSKGILITRPFAPSGTWVLDGNSGTFGQGAVITAGSRTAQLHAGASMTNLIEVDSSMLYTFLTIQNLDFSTPSTGLATNVIHSNKGNTSYHLTIKDNVFANTSGRCINLEYLNASVRVIGNFAANCTFFWTLRGGNYECMGKDNELTFVTYGVQLLHQGGGTLGIEGFKYFHNTHLACTVSVYMGGSYMCWIKDNMLGSHRGSGNGIWMDSTSHPNTSNQICGNFIGGEGYGNFGIVVNGTGANCNDNTFIGNEISEWSQAGIAIAGSGNDTYLGQTVKDNILRYVGTPAQAAIILVDTPGALVKNNHLYTGGGTGLSLGGTSTGSIYGNNIYRGGGQSVGGSGWSNEGANR